MWLKRQRNPHEIRRYWIQAAGFCVYCEFRHMLQPVYQIIQIGFREYCVVFNLHRLTLSQIKILYELSEFQPPEKKEGRE